MDVLKINPHAYQGGRRQNMQGLSQALVFVMLLCQVQQSHVSYSSSYENFSASEDQSIPLNATLHLAPGGKKVTITENTLRRIIIIVCDPYFVSNLFLSLKKKTWIRIVLLSWRKLLKWKRVFQFIWEGFCVQTFGVYYLHLHWIRVLLGVIKNSH